MQKPRCPRCNCIGSDQPRAEAARLEVDVAVKSLLAQMLDFIRLSPAAYRCAVGGVYFR